MLLLAALYFLPAWAQEARPVYLPLVARNFLPGLGLVSGKVISASSGAPIANAQVCVGGQCLASSEQGEYHVENVWAGGRPLIASANGYNTITDTVFVRASQVVTRNLALSTNLAPGDIAMRIVLTWDSTPAWPPGYCDNDLDAHLWLTVGSSVFHIFPGERGDCTIYPNACDEQDVVRGSGPETIAIRAFEQDATYYYGVHNYNQIYTEACPGVPTMTRTSAIARIYDKNGLFKEYVVPSEGNGNFWYVFELNGDTHQFTDRNCIGWYSDNPPVCP